MQKHELLTPKGLKYTATILFSNNLGILQWKSLKNLLKLNFSVVFKTTPSPKIPKIPRISIKNSKIYNIHERNRKSILSYKNLQVIDFFPFRKNIIWVTRGI